MITPSYENSFRVLIESLNHVLFTLDDCGKITYISPGCREILGFSAEEMTGKPLSTFCGPSDKGCIGEPSGQAQGGKNHPSCFPIVGKDGFFHQARVISRQVWDEETTGLIGLLCGTSSDIQTEKIIRQANATIHLLNSIVRHDINNQLTVLQGYLSLMEQNDGTIASPEVARVLLNATERVHKMVTFTSEYKEAGTHLPSWVNLGNKFQSARSSVETAGVQFTIDPSCEELELFTDPMLLRVFHHLIDNSLRHGMGVTEISLQWRLERGNVTIVYEDNGTGISATARSTLFQPGKTNKTGYGLFLVREILAISGFTITETGSPGRGARFEIIVPAGSFRMREKKNV